MSGFGSHKLPFGAIITAFVLIISGGWASDAIKGEVLFPWIPHAEEYRLFIIAVVILLFFISSAILYQIRHQYLPVRSLGNSRSTPLPVLIMLISKPNILPPEIDAKSLQLKDRDGIKVELKGKTLKEDIGILTTIK